MDALNSEHYFVYDLGHEVTAFTTKREADLPFPVVQAHQTHSLNVAVVESSATTREQLEGIDALVTNVPGVAIGARTADCIPVLLFDPVHHAVAAVHSGWRGTVGKISQCAIRRMTSEYGTSPSDIRAVIGPGIGPGSFQVGKEVVETFEKAGFPMELIHHDDGPKVEGTMKGGDHIDLWKAVRWTLESEGVPSGSISCLGVCSYENNDILFSARREGISCGRTLSVIMLNQPLK